MSHQPYTLEQSRARARSLRAMIRLLRENIQSMSEQIEHKQRALCPQCWMEEPGTFRGSTCPACEGTGLREEAVVVPKA